MQRRSYLAALAGATATGLAGCSSTGPATRRPSTSMPATTTGTPSVDASADPTTDGERITVEATRARPSVVRVGVHSDVWAGPDVQYLVVDAAVPGADDPRAAYETLAERLDVAVSGPGDPRAGTPVPTAVGDGDATRLVPSYPLPRDVAPTALAVVAGDPADPDRRWPVDPGVLDALANPPAFAVRGLTVPERVTRGEGFDATVTVANIGAREGRFLAELGATTLSDTGEISTTVAAGAERAVTFRLSPHYLPESDDLTVRLDWGRPADWQTERSVDVVQQ